ncbi:hypothetical protein SPHV1_2280081 [Novosphingobium sp. KN65.2]|nr:hypothetical protein SPHV1_2280081 [Novosphingobium sp. KN65.2]
MLHRPGLAPADEAPDLSFWPEAIPRQGQFTKTYHPWTNGQAERMVRIIKEATVKSSHYASLTKLLRAETNHLVLLSHKNRQLGDSLVIGL